MNIPSHGCPYFIDDCPKCLKKESTPNNTAGEEWEKEFDEEFRLLFNDKGKSEWKAGLQEFSRGENVGDKRKQIIKSFIHKTCQAAIAEERGKLIGELLLKSQKFVDVAGFRSALRSYLIPTPDNSSKI